MTTNAFSVRPPRDCPSEGGFCVGIEARKDQTGTDQAITLKPIS